MNILHTSDWHLGQSFFTQNRKQEHQQFLQWLLAQVDEHQIDAIIVAGDIFDTATPPSYAREMYNQFVVSLQSHQCSLIVLGGNHDSVSVLQETKSLLAYLNTQVIAACMDDLSEQLVELTNQNGDVSALICAIPFIRPRDVLKSEAGLSGDDKKKQLGEAIARHYHDLYQLAVQRKTELGLDIPIIATGHLTALGVAQSDSVRDIYIGTLEGFPADAFPPADYIALGHIHRAQVVAKSAHIRYSGSPIPLSFDELGSTKKVMKVSFDGSSLQAVDAIDVPLFQPMAILRGDLTDIATQLAAFENSDTTTWLCVEVTTQGYLSDLHQQIQALTEHLPVEVLQLRRVHQRASNGGAEARDENLAELKPQDVFEKRLALLPEDTPAEEVTDLRQRFQDILTTMEEEATE